ncbi:hypothetical protein K435DRAFT_742211 [Dendrothele bispora CBS 962.96]|uniref:TEA domain-containing protein n=1 Tax=Dendrothele bispora (strain CBS 962.96) TaxID=1314807 RepID=A0A4S8MVB5_DENBC|nr:hypothetical protein K435DRAFT_742211 [Dendrothele bispora CBS 962.96]
MSTVDDLSYTPSAEEKTRDAAQIVATGRRSWKTLKGKGEAVWPPHLEAALIEALEKYKPDDSRSSKTLGRFSMRNRFISDYIFETTGKRRTPKQVGSRLQQLRDTCKSERILQLISRRNLDEGDSSTMSSDANSSSNSPPPEKPQTRQATRSAAEQRSFRRSNVWVNILLEKLAWSSHTPVVHIVNNDRMAPVNIHLAPLSGTSSSSLSYSTSHRLSNMEPTITFVSPCALALQCSFSVFLDGSGLPIHTEVASLKCHSSPMQSSGWMYSATLVPGLWKSLCEENSPTRYTVMQNLFPARSSGSASLTAELDETKEECISVVYNFAYPDSAPGELQSPIGFDSYSSGFSYQMNDSSLGNNRQQSWYSSTANTDNFDWNGSYPVNSYSHNDTISSYSSDVPSGYGLSLPAISRSGRSVSYSNDWVSGQKYPQSQMTLQYC